jgi:hypothetical protein
MRIAVVKNMCSLVPLLDKWKQWMLFAINCTWNRFFTAVMWKHTVQFHSQVALFTYGALYFFCVSFLMLKTHAFTKNHAAESCVIAFCR